MAQPWDELPAVVLDNGSGVVKCGFAGEDVPKSVFPAVVGYPRASAPDAVPLVGDDALAAKGVKLTYPVDHGIVSDWEGLERVWRRCYEEISAVPENQAVLLTEAPMNPKANREKMAEVMFEGIGVPALQVQIQAVLSLYCAGRITGCVLDSGDGVTHSVPVFEGHAIPTAIRRLDMAGRDLTEWMMELLSDETGLPFTNLSHRETARRIKEELSYVAPDFDHELDSFDQETSDAAEKKKSFTLPDGNKIEIGRSLFCCPELLFNPAIAEKPCASVQSLIHDSVQACGVDIRRPLLHDILMSGGTTMFRGMQERLQTEVMNLTTKRGQDDVRVVAPGERKFSVWMGAAILASLTSFSAEWVTKAEYQEEGANILHQRCNAHGFALK